MRKKSTLLHLIRESFSGLLRNDPLRLAGATAFFATFAIPAILVIILQIARLILTQKEGKEELFAKVEKYVGSASATHLINLLGKFERIADGTLPTIIGFVFLLFVGTTLFKVIKNSINQIWDVEVVAEKSVTLTLSMRLRELAVIILAGILFLVALFLDSLQAMASKEFLKTSALAGIALSGTISFVISVFIASIWFGLIFSFLADGRFPLITSIKGAFVTSLLFNIGKLVLKAVLLNGKLLAVFGNSAAVILLLLFVFYSALIFYLGAAFTKALASRDGTAIKPLSHAKKVEE